MQKIRKDDEIIVLTGKYKGKRGKVLKIVNSVEDRLQKVFVEGVNMIKKHVKPNPQQQQPDKSGVQPSLPLGQNETYASAQVISTSNQGLPPSCSRAPVADPSELLPKDTNSQWAQLNPTGSGDLENVNLLRSGYHMGIDTIGNSLRNANQQLRSEPSNPQLNVGPWNNTTISPDTMRVPLEIGQGGQ